jgi:peptidoglycan/xylan/chitin deacetylase (PgdA/CDA1 family)
MVHGVIDDRLQAAWRPLRQQLTVKNLDSGLAALSRFYHFISLDQAVTMLTGEATLLPFSAVLTFDDGYRNNVTHALPILQRHGVPATFFLSTGHVERREPFWYDRLDYAIQHLRKEQHVSFSGQNFFFRPNQEEISRTTFTALRNMVKANKIPYSETILEVNRMANSLEENADCRLNDVFEDDHSTAIMSWEDARWAADQGVTIGSHTVDHVMLDRLIETSVREQLTVSKMMIEQRTGRKCLYFCYPYARWDAKILSLVQQAGFVAAVTTDTGANKAHTNLLALHRMGFPKV